MDQDQNQTEQQVHHQAAPTEADLDQMLNLIRSGDDNKENMPPAVLEAAPEVSAHMGRPSRPAFQPVPPEHALDSIDFLPRFGELALDEVPTETAEGRPGAPEGWDQHGRRYERPLSAMGEGDPFPYGRRMARPLHRRGRRVAEENWVIWVDEQERMEEVEEAEARRRERRDERSMAPSPEGEERSVLGDISGAEEGEEGNPRVYAEVLAREFDRERSQHGTSRRLRRQRGTRGLREEAMESPLRREVSFHRR